MGSRRIEKKPLNYQQYNQQNGGPPVAQPPNGLPYPPGYRPRTPLRRRCRAQPQAVAMIAASSTLPVSGAGGKVMYFQKPADALTATGGSGSTMPGKWHS